MYATNTFRSCGVTWKHTDGSGRRHDYIGLQAGLFSQFLNVWESHDIDISPGARDDRRVLCCKIDLAPLHADRQLSKRKARFTVDTSNLADTGKVNRCQEMFWKYQAKECSDIDQPLDSFIAHVKISSLRVFGRERKKPRQCWMSAQTWNIVQMSAPLRRSQ